MAWTLTFAALALVSGLSQSPHHPDDPKLAPGSTSETQPESVHPPAWLAALRLTGPVTTTDPQHVAVAVGLAHQGEYRASVQYQPTSSGRIGLIAASLGVRVMQRDTWDLAFDLEHSQARPVRRLFHGAGWELDGHERHQLSIGTASVRWQQRRFFGLVTGTEVGAGRMHIWRYVSAQAGGSRLSPSPDPILESSAIVGLVGVRAAHRLFSGLDAQVRLRVIGAGRSRGGEVPFAHLTAEWDLARQVFRSHKFGRAFLGLTGNHATSSRAVSYFQNGLGLSFRLAF
jgi:hypothetical protein